MNAVEEQQFVHNYSKFVIGVWTDSGVRNTLESHPAETLKQFGIFTPADAKIVVEDSQGSESGDAGLRSQLAAWQKGADTGTYTLYVPKQPSLGMQGTAESNLVADTSYCCCCCPCCTCT